MLRAKQGRRRLLIATLVLAAAIGSGVSVSSPRAEAETFGDVTGFGNAPALGSPREAPSGFSSAVVATPSGEGYWVASTDGGVYTYGDAHYYGAPAEFGVSANIVDLASTPSGRGYWAVAIDGAVYAFGDAHYYGGANGIRHPGWVVSVVPTKSGRGYWLLSTDGGVFTYGDAQFLGSAQNLAPDVIVVDGARTASGNGYWLALSDGGVLSFGDAQFFGSATDVRSSAITGIAADEENDGYWLVGTDGGVYTFSKNFHGSTFGRNEETMTVDIAARPNGDGYWVVTGPHLPPAPAVPPPAGGVWEALRNCEAGGNYAANTGNGYYGAYQFSAPTWRSMNTGYAYAHEAPYWVQDDAARRLQERSGWGQWPACTRKLGLR